MRAGDELREARVSLGLSQDAVGRACFLSQSQVSRIERGTLASVSLDQLCRVGAVLGLNTSLKFYPGGQPLRDQAQLNLLDRFRREVGTPLRCRSEVPIPIEGDLRAWDLQVVGGVVPIGLDAETRLRDCQAVERRLMLKARDSEIERIVLLVADTHANRRAIRDAGPTFAERFPVPARSALRELRAGRVPPGSSLILL
jgi:transcriptional regulator with XRE-family HTH domain